MMELKGLAESFSSLAIGVDWSMQRGACERRLLERSQKEADSREGIEEDGEKKRREEESGARSGKGPAVRVTEREKASEEARGMRWPERCTRDGELRR